MTEDPIRVLFVCLGNICRSPLAEGVFRSLVRARELESRYLVDSAGTGAWHAGERPDQRSAEVARRNGVVLAGRARQIEAPDFADFDYVIAMDRQNLLELRTMARSPQGEAHLHLLRAFDPEPGDGQVPDPYYGGPDGFEHMYEMVNRACEALLDHLEERRLDRTTNEG
jgi:protein-tyrosine phosphatase